MEQILDAMEYSVYAYDVEHIILDNLQFMMGASYKGYERFDAQERALHEFRNCLLYTSPSPRDTT